MTEPQECPNCHNRRHKKDRRVWRLFPIIHKGETGWYFCQDCRHCWKPEEPIVRKVFLTVNYGSWSNRAKTHAVVVERDDQAGCVGERLCDGRESIYNMGYAGTLASVSCVKCRRKLARLRIDGVEIVEATL